MDLQVEFKNAPKYHMPNAACQKQNQLRIVQLWNRQQHTLGFDYSRISYVGLALTRGIGWIAKSKVRKQTYLSSNYSPIEFACSVQVLTHSFIKYIKCHIFYLNFFRKLTYILIPRADSPIHRLHAEDYEEKCSLTIITVIENIKNFYLLT